MAKDATSSANQSATDEEQDAKNLPDEEVDEQEVADAAESADESDSESDDLGEAGKRALVKERERVKAERQKRREVELELQKLRDGAKSEGDKPTADDIRREAEKAATQKANARIVRSEIRAAAAGKLADPKDALTFLNVDQFEVDEDGEVDADEITDAIDELLKNKPYLAAATAKRFQGTADGGAARKAGKPKQLTRADVERMTPEQINEARENGQLNDLLAGKKG